MNHPLVSVIVPVFNGEATIEQCVKSFLVQDYPQERYEIIVVNNNSTDRSVEIVRQNPVVLLDEKKQGPAAARNRGLARVRGEIVAFIDADCFAETRWLRELVKPFSDPAVGGVGGAIGSASRATAVERYADDRGILNHSLSSPFFLPYLVTANAAFRKELIDSVGGFDENFTKAAGEDVDLSWRIQLNTPCTFVFAEKAVVYHKHRDTLSGLFAQAFNYHLAFHKKYIKFSQYDSYPTRSVGGLIQRFWAPVYGFPKWVGGPVLKWIVGRSSRDEMLYPFFEWVWGLGVAAGILKGALEHLRYHLQHFLASR